MMAKASNSEADSDELAAFVSSTLLAITKAVRHVQADLKKVGGENSGFGFGAPEHVEFDVAVTAKKMGKGEGGLKLEVFSVSASVGGHLESEHSSVSRVRFMIPSGKNAK